MVAELVGLIGAGKGAKFANLTYRSIKNNELARYHLILGASTEKLYQKDVAALEAALPALAGIELVAAQELLNSRNESLTKGIGNNAAYTNADTYVLVDGIPGIKVHKETGVVYVTALAENKQVLEAGEPQKPVNSSAKTIAKNKLRHSLPSGRFRQFVLKRVTKAVLNGETLEIEGEG